MMTQKQQQRLIGTLLLVFFIAVLAYLVLSKVSQTESGRQATEEEPIEFSSVIEPLQEKTDDVAELETDTSSSAEEAFVDIDPQVTDNTAQLPEAFVTEPVTPEPENVVPTPVDIPKPELAAKAPEPKPAPKDPEPQPAPEAAAEPAEGKPEPSVTPADTTTAPAEAVSRWILQLGSFSVEANAISRKKQLEDLGYKPMIEQTRSGGTVIYRVRLQPNEDRAVLEKMAESIRNQLKINTQIFPYQ